MKFSKRYAFFILIIIGTLIWKLNNWNDRYAAVEPFRGAALKEEVLYPLMSKNLNDSGTLHVYINDVRYDNNDQGVVLDDRMVPVASLEFIRSSLKGSAFMSDEDTAIVQIVNDIYGISADTLKATENTTNINLKSLPSMRGNSLYIGVEDLCDIFGYEYSYNKTKYEVKITYDKAASLPAKYDLRDMKRVSKIRNQGSTSTCWACASLEAMESSLLPSDSYYFDVDSMIGNNSFKLKEEAGGDYTMALAYLLGWQGPVEAEKEETSPVHLQEVHFYDSEDLDEIKWAVYQHGGVSTSIYASVSSSNLSNTSSYNRLTNSYCYMGNEKPNHDVVIVGWDDNFKASAFSTNVPGDGAFICQNSWGTGFGNNGIFYISYYDTNIGNQAVSYVKTDLNNRYNYIYQSDLCGWVGQVGYSKEWAYGANTYEATDDMQIDAAGFYALGKNTSYQLYFVNNYKNTSSLATKELVAKGSLTDAGYYTINFNQGKTVSKGENFAVVLYINTPDASRPMAVEYMADDMTANVDLEDGRGYISNNGLDWENVEDVAGANLCLKAYGNNIIEVFEE
ncbi:MAG: cell surface protein [Pseudobutyrivibrio sp.]|nr:cell surface protein [Pseudobutyrivibrio sp.]